MINLFLTILWVPKKSPPLSEIYQDSWNSAYNCILSQDMSQTHSKNTQLDHNRKRQAEKSMSGFLLPSPSCGSVHLCILLSLATKNAMMYSVSVQGSHQSVSTQGLYWGMVTQAPSAYHIPPRQLPRSEQVFGMITLGMITLCEQSRHSGLPLSLKGRSQVPNFHKCQPRASLVSRALKKRPQACYINSFLHIYHSCK